MHPRGPFHVAVALATALALPCLTAETVREQAIQNYRAAEKKLAEFAAKGGDLTGEKKLLFDALYPLAKLKLDQAMLYLDDVELYPTRQLKASLASMAPRSATGPDYSKAGRLLPEIDALSKLFDAGQDPLAKQSGRIVERAYIAKNDGSAQPYYLYVPEKYSDEKKWPLFIFLHGWVPETSKIDPWLCPEDVLPIADELEFLYLQPHGRRNTDFQFVGEIDVLESIRQTQRFYNVDADRIYLIGASMGGGGVWNIAMHQPHEFAGISPINGQIDWFSFWQDLFRYPSKDELPPHQQWLISYNNPMDLAGSLRALPTYMQHALGDHINKVQYARQIYAKLKNLDCPAEVYYDKSSLGHFIYFRSDVYRRAFETLIKYRRNNAPKVVQHHTYSTRFPKAHWITIESLKKWGPIAKIAAEVEGDTITVKTENVNSYYMDLPETLIGNRVKVLSDGKTAHDGAMTDGRRIRVGTMPPGLNKTQEVSGPIPEALNFPFTVVRGTTGTKPQQSLNKTNVERFLTDWWAYAEGLPPVRDDSQVSEKDIAGRNLILFGDAESNSYIKRIQSKLPIKVNSDSYVIGDKTIKRSVDTGLAMIYPNPLNQKKYVVIFSGLHWGEKRGSNHKYDLLPDFIVYNNEFDEKVATNHALCAGFFDTRWKLSSELTWSD